MCVRCNDAGLQDQDQDHQQADDEDYLLRLATTLIFFTCINVETANASLFSRSSHFRPVIDLKYLIRLVKLSDDCLTI